MAGECDRDGPAKSASSVGLFGLSDVIGGAGRETPDRQLAGIPESKRPDNRLYGQCFPDRLRTRCCLQRILCSQSCRSREARKRGEGV